MTIPANNEASPPLATHIMSFASGFAKTLVHILITWVRLVPLVLFWLTVVAAFSLSDNDLQSLIESFLEANPQELLLTIKSLFSMLSLASLLMAGFYVHLQNSTVSSVSGVAGTSIIASAPLSGSKQIDDIATDNTSKPE